MRKQGVTITGILALILIGIGMVDYVLKERPSMQIAVTEEPEISDVPVEPDEPIIEEPVIEEPTTLPEESEKPTEEPIRQPVKKGVSRSSGPSVKETLIQHDFTWTEFVGQSMIATTIGSDVTQTLTLLINEDRAAGLAWIDSPDVKDIFRSLKQALQESFSGNVTDLVDETQRPAVGAPRDILSFRDPAISSERIVFVRMRTRLYEFHIAEGQDQNIADLIETLGK